MVIRDDGRRLTATIERLLEYAGAQSGRFVYELRDSDIAEVCKAAVADLQHEIDNAGFTVETKIEANLPKIRADPHALKRALQNLIKNAIKYRRGQPWIGLSAQASSTSAKVDELEIKVADCGRGIPKSELPHIFEPFFRGADITAAQIPGSGLGLSLVQHTVAAHGGRVRVESIFGEGTSFTIHLPFSRPVDPHENA
jgi:signal transduction histidine kinase